MRTTGPRMAGPSRSARGARTGRGEIGIADVQSGVLRVLKSVDWHGPERIFFSRDGRYLAYDGLAPGSETQRDIFVMAVDGSREVPAIVHSADDQVLGWAPRRFAAPVHE